MDPILINFINDFYSSFHPPCPRLSTGDWLVSKVWSDYLRGWLDKRYVVTYEFPGRLDAALWVRADPLNPKSNIPDIALEWKWDQNKVEKQFPYGDFRKIFRLNARCGLAIIQTRIDRTRGVTQADNTIQQLRRCATEYLHDNRSIAVIENRRVVCTKQKVEFRSFLHDLSRTGCEEKANWIFP